jgi:uncharacterized protein YjbI with pentapeptide repeats
MRKFFQHARFSWFNFLNTKFGDALKNHIGLVEISAFVLSLIGFSFYFIREPITYYPKWYEFFSNIHSDLIGTGITVLILGNLDKYLRINDEKRRLILQMGSPDNSFAREAVRQLQHQGWLYNGTTKNAILVEANLKKAIMDYANLENAIFLMAELNEARLIDANLRNANLASANLNGTLLFDANLEEADLREANLEQAILWGANLQYANITNTNFQGAKYDEETKWPYYIDPIILGAEFNNAEEKRKIMGTIKGVFG